MPSIAYIAFGSNLGDRAAHLRHAIAALRAHPRIKITAISPVYETAAHTLNANEVQPAFLNGVVAIRTQLTPEELLAVCQHLEAAAGRRRTRPWAPRPLDLDLLLYDQQQRHTEALTLPHPRLAERRFVLQPLADLAPTLRLSAPFNDTVASLLAHCTDTDESTLVPISWKPTDDGS